MKNPPILIAVIGFFGALAGFGYIFFGLRVLGFDWFGLFGDLPATEHVGIWGWLAVLAGIAWLLAALGLWALQPWARLFAQIVAGFALLEAVIAFFQFPGTGYAFGLAVMPLLILWYLSTAEVKEAFGLTLPKTSGADEWSVPASAPAPAAPATAAAPAVAFAASGAAVADAPASVEEPAAPPMAAAAAVAAAPEPEAPAAPEATAAPDAPVARAINLIDIEGIGPAYAQKLAEAGVHTTADLLASAGSRAGRARLADATGISGQLILEWVNDADLMRIPGVGTQYSDLLEAAGVDSPAELAQRNASNLATTFQELVAARPGTVRRVPTEADVAQWIEAARSLPRAVEH